MIQIIPAIDLIDGKCVRLRQGNFAQSTTYGEDPVDIAKKYSDFGIKRLHLVDLDGAKSKKVINWRTLEAISANTPLIIDFGGGIQSQNDLEIAFDSGADMITAGSIAVKHPPLAKHWLQKYGPDKIILGADYKDQLIAVSGWEENTQIQLMDLIALFGSYGFRKVISTDISRDGMLNGPDVKIYQTMKQTFPEMDIIASGGIRNINDVRILNEKNIYGVIIGKALLEGTLNLKELEPFLC